MINPNMAKQLILEFVPRILGTKTKKVHFIDAHCINYHEHFDSTGTVAMTISLNITAAGVKDSNSSEQFEEYWLTTRSNTTPVTTRDDQEEEETQVAVDIYIDSQTGHRCKEIKPTTKNYRIINYFDYDDILTNYGSRINSKEAVDELKLFSKEVRFDNAKIQQEIQNVSDKSRLSEYQVYLVIERVWNDVVANDVVVTAEKDTHTKLHLDGKINMSISGLRGNNGKEYALTDTGRNLVIGQVHGHNKTQKARTENAEGTSDKDKIAATNNAFNIYSLRAYDVKVGGQAKIDKVDGDGKEFKDIGNTKGHFTVVGKENVSKGTINIGLDALDFYSKK